MHWQGAAPLDISPIATIRPVTPVKPASIAPDLSRVFEVEYLGDHADDEYRPGNRRTARGLEDEEETREETGMAAEELSPSKEPIIKVDFFA